MDLFEPDAVDNGQLERIASLQLALLPGVGPRLIAALLEQFETASAVLSATPQQLSAVDGVGPKLMQTITTASDHVAAESIIAWCSDHGCDILCRDDADYPTQLAELYDPPSLLFVRGKLQPEDQLAVAIVGTRHATAYGLTQAERFAYGLSRAGMTVVSGLARGIDAAAHEGALAASGRTLAVLGGGLGEIYPPEHRGLAERVSNQGAVLSEYAPHAKPRGGMFPQRNRLIAGLSVATLVIEAPDRSGALITARLAGEQGQAVLALPGAVTSRASRGCNQLIRDGATLVQTVDDVLEAVGPIGHTIATDDGLDVRNGAELKLNELERQVLAAIDTTSIAVDQVIQACDLPAHRVIATISVLEMRHLVRRLSGQYVIRI